MANEDIDQALAQSTAAAVQGDFLGAFLAPVKITIARVLEPGRTTTLQDVDPARAALESPFRNAAEATGLLDAIELTANSRRLAAGLPVDRRPARAAIRRGQLLNAFIIQAPLSLLEGIIGASQRGVVLPTQAPPQDLQAFRTEAPVAETPIRQANYTQGVEREFNTEVQPATMKPSIQAVLDMGRYLTGEAIEGGAGVQFFDGSFNLASGAIIALRMPSLGDEVIGISEVNLQVGLNNAVNNKRFIIRCGAVRTGGTGNPPPFLRMHGAFGFDADQTAPYSGFALNHRLGRFLVGPREDYVISAVALTTVTIYTLVAAVEARKYKSGVNPGGFM